MSTDVSPVREAVSAPSRASPAPKSRLLYIDNLRIVLISMVVLLHLAITYGAVGDWSYKEKVPENMASAVVLTLYTTIAQAFTLAFFYMISSYFNPPAYDRKGPGAFVKDKLKRLGIPLLFYWAVLNPLQVVIIRACEGQSAVPPDQSFLSFWVDNLSVGPMWFVEALLIFSLFYVLWRLATARRPRPRRSLETSEVSRTQGNGQDFGGLQRPPKSEPEAPGNGVMALFALIVGLVTFVVRLAWPVDRWLEPFHFQLAQHTQYIAYFVVGLIAYRRNWFTGVRVAQAKPWAWVAVGLVLMYPVIIVLSGALEKGIEEFKGGFTWQSALYSVWEEFLSLAIIVALLVWFRERLNRQGHLAAAMGAATYAVYVFHPLVIVPLAFALSGIYMIGVAKWVLVAPLALALCFLVAHYIRKLPVARDIL
jgi:fucose 4-O-acetylase-like acetyltransferase